MSDRYQQVGAVFSGTLRSEGTQHFSAPLPIRRRKTSLTRVLVSHTLMALVLVAGWFVGLRPYLHELVQKEIDGVLSNAVDQIDRVPILSISPDPLSIPLSEMTINNLIVLYSAPSDPVQHMKMQITPRTLRVDFQVYGYACDITLIPAVSSGQLIVGHVTVEGIVALIMSSDEITSIVNAHLRDARAKIRRNVVGVILKNHEMDLMLN
jgi:hypothetical protein